MSDGDETVNKIVSTVGLWWPDAEEGDIRTAARAWEAFARAIDDAHTDGRGGAAQARGHWTGGASEAFGTHWQQFDKAMPLTAEGARSLASALDEYADEVEHAKHQVYELAIEIGASIAIGTALAFFTFGTSEAAAAGTIATLRAAAMRIAAQLTERVGTIAARSIIGAGFGAVSSLGGDAIGQVARVEGFGDGGYSATEALEATAVGGVTGGVLGGAGGAISKVAKLRGGRVPTVGGEEPPTSALRTREVPEPGTPAPGARPRPPMSAEDRAAHAQHLDEVAARNPEKYEELRRDPDHGGRLGANQDEEAKIAIDMSEQGRWSPDVSRPDAGAQGDFRVPGADGDRHVDIKGFHSDYPDRVPLEKRTQPFPEAVTEQDFVKSMDRMFRKDLDVVLDSRNLDARSLDFMQRIIEEKGWQSRVEWYP